MAVLEVVCVEFYHRECAFMITMSCRWVLRFSLALHTVNSYCCGCMLHSVFQTCGRWRSVSVGTWGDTTGNEAEQNL